MKYRAEIDGLRALAVVPVILFHAGLEPFGGGYVGVDVFFVISGYLITTIILNELQQDRFSIVNFYERRARRILPALFVVIIACLPFAWVWLDPFALKEFFQSLTSVAVFSSNIFFYLKTGYFDTAAEFKPLLHTWSLAVEEQYYIFFPLILMALFRFGLSALTAALVVIFFVSLGLAEWGAYHSPNAAFFLLPTRGWELLLGGFCALYLNKRPPISSYALNQLMSLAGFGLILFAVFAFDKTTPTPSLYTLIPTVGVVLIILFANPGTIVQRVLSLGPIVAIGLVSYSAYLWHQPILVFFRVITLEEPSLAWVAILTALTFVLAYLTYVLVEQPFRNKTSWKISRTGIFAGSAAGIVLFATAGVAGHVYQGFPARNPDFLRLQQNFGISARCSGAPIDSAKCKTNSDPKVIIWGDSHAMHLAGALKLIFEKDGLWQTTLSACPPVPGFKEATRNALTDCFDYNEIVQRRLMSIENPSQYTIFMSAAKDLTLPEVRDDFAKSVKALKQRGFKLYVISTTPRFGSVKRCVIASIRGGEGFDQCRYDFQSAENRDYFKGMQAFAQELGIGFVDLKDLFCDGSQCGVARDGKLLLRDSAHFAVEAAPVLARYLAPRIGYPTGASVSD